MKLARRTILMSAIALAACKPAATPAPTTDVAAAPPPDDPRFAAIEQRIGGRVGVAAWNTGTDAWLGHRRNEVFAMCSTFKWALAAGVLKTAQNGGPQLDARVRFSRADLVGNSPRVEANLARGWMTVEELCAATVIQSDNAAANLLLPGIGGPEGFTGFMRANGDSVTRLDRIETAMSENLPNDVRDTTTPDAMTRSLQRFLLTEEVLNASDREKLTGWMEAARTGLRRIRAGLPEGWRLAHKTGTMSGANNAANDVAILWPPSGSPLVLSIYLSHSTAEEPARDDAVAEITRIVAAEWG